MASTDELLPKLYALLRARASSLLAARDVSLSPDSLVHDVMLKLYRSDRDAWESEAHFRAVAARAMRHVIIDHQRRRRAAKRDGERVDVSISLLADDPSSPVDLFHLDRALEELEAARPQVAEVVVLRVLGGLNHQEIADQLGLSESTVKRYWRTGRAWLRSRLETP